MKFKRRNTDTLFGAIRLPKTQYKYWLTRYVILRLLGIIYAIGFLVAINQILPLIGSNGLLPLNDYIKQINDAIGPTSGFFRLPSIFWFNHSDAMLITIAWIGFLLSCIVVAGYANAIVLAMLWFLYMSFVHLGQDWYSYGWEIQLLETGFLAIFLCPLINMRPFAKEVPPPLQIIILFRWLIFRIMLGSGLIKIRWDNNWRNGTALYYHFETQPIPGPLSRWFHFLPRIVLRIGVWFNFLAELAAPWFVFWPRLARHIAGVIIILFQLNIILSGNLSFLNWLTIIPALACLDDGFWSKILPRYLVRKAETAARYNEQSRSMQTASWIVTVVVIFLSVAPVINMFSSNQIMNTSFDPFDLVNTYGAFGTVGQERLNVVFEGTNDNDTTDNAHWQPYLYKGLPVLLNKKPPQIAPYHLRLDWQMWFASMASADEYPWTLNLEWKLLHNDAGTLSLFANNPFPNHPPKYIRAVLYRYSFVQPNAQGLWWKRTKITNWINPTYIDDPRLIHFLKTQGWLN